MVQKKQDLKKSLWNRWLGKLTKQGTEVDVQETPKTRKGVKKRNVTAAQQAKNTKAETAFDIALFENKLRNIASSRNAITAGRLQLLNIEPVAREIGDRWPKLRDKAHLKIESVLNKYLGPRDIFHRHKEFLYAVVFADIGGTEAKSLMSIISVEIERILHGEDTPLAGLELRTATVEMDGKVVLKSFGSSSAIDDFVASAGVQDEHDNPENAPVGSPAPISNVQAIARVAEDKKLEEIERAHEMIKARLDSFSSEPIMDAPMTTEFQLLRDIEGELFRLHDRIARRVPLIEKTVQGTSSTPPLLADDHNEGYPRPATVLLMEAENAFMGANAAQRKFCDEEHDLTLSFGYRPCWHVKKGVLGTYFSSANFKEKEVTRPTEIAFHHRMGDDINALIDRCHLRRALLDLEDQRDNITGFVSVPLHYSTLRHTSHRHTFQYLLHSMPAWCRDMTAWEIIGMPPDAMLNHVEDIISLLRPFGRNYYWRLQPTQTALKQLKKLPLDTVGISISENKDETRILDVIDSLAGAAESIGFKTYIRGAHTRSLVVAAACAGVDKISGDAVAGMVDNIKGVSLFSEEQLYANILASAFKRD